VPRVRRVRRLWHQPISSGQRKVERHERNGSNAEGASCCVTGESLLIGAPIAGRATALDEVPDAVFAGRVLGDGLAIDPFESTLRAPCDGVITTSHRAHHALTLRTSQGAEILVHIGLDTVALNGKEFDAHVAEGQAVRAAIP
jgi:glucose-specific phosphotransferase system IIA component